MTAFYWNVSLGWTCRSCGGWVNAPTIHFCTKPAPQLEKKP